MGPRRWIALIAIAFGALIALAGPAGGHRAGLLAHIACANDATACSEHGDISTPAHGTGVQATDVVPNGSTQGSEVITPFSKDELKSFDSLWFGVVDATPSLVKVKNVFVRRLLTCAIIAPAVASFGTPTQVMALASSATLRTSSPRSVSRPCTRRTWPKAARARMSPPAGAAWA